MREIKFRAWKKSTKFMFDWDDIRTHGWIMRDFDEEDLVFMQYTGLKDKKGIDIFEGDIVVRYYYYDDLYPDGYDPRVRRKKVVTWVNKPSSQLGFNIRNLKDGTASHLLVIGNIYENPELLKGDN